MRDRGLYEVENPSMMLLSGRPVNVSGTCVACAMEGSRPLLAEVQGLVSPTGFGNPRRMTTGFDYNRLSLLLAACWKAEGYFSPTLTPTSTSSAACGWMSRLRICRWRSRWCPA